MGFDVSSSSVASYTPPPKNIKDEHVTIDASTTNAQFQTDLKGAISSGKKEIFLSHEVQGKMVTEKIDLTANRGMLNNIVNAIKDNPNFKLSDISFSPAETKVSGPGFDANSQSVSSNLASKLEAAKKSGDIISPKEMEGILRTALSDDGAISPKELKMINDALGDKGDLTNLKIESKNKFSFTMNHQDFQVQTKFADAQSVTNYLQNDGQANAICSTLNVPNPPVTKIDKGAVAYTMAMVEKREDYMSKNSGLLVAGTANINFNSTAFRDLPPEDKKKLILDNPDMAFADKQSNLQTRCGMSGASADASIKGNASSLRFDLTNRAQSIFENMGEKGKIPSQYLSAVGDGSGSTGIANTTNLGLGYFSYDKVGTGTASENSFKIKAPLTENLEMKFASYGFNDGVGTSPNSMTMQIGDKVNIQFTITPAAGGKGQMGIDMSSGNVDNIKAFLGNQSPAITLANPPTQADITAKLARAGVTIDVDKGTVVLNKDKYGGLDVQNIVTGAGSSDERQVQVSSNGDLNIGKSNKFEAKDLYDSAQFSAEKSKMSIGQQNLIASMAANGLPMPALTTRPQEIDLNKFFTAKGGGVNPDGQVDGKDVTNLNSAQKDNLRSTSAEMVGGKILISSFTDPDKTGLNQGANNDFHDFYKSQVGADLKAQFKEKGVYVENGSDNNNTLSSLRSLSFMKVMVMEKYKDVQPPLSNADFEKMTVTISVKDQAGNDVTINAKLSDVPPK